MSEELTKHFEEEMESIREGKMTEITVLDEAKKYYANIVMLYGNE